MGIFAFETISASLFALLKWNYKLLEIFETHILYLNKSIISYTFLLTKFEHFPINLSVFDNCFNKYLHYHVRFTFYVIILTIYVGNFIKLLKQNVTIYNLEIFPLENFLNGIILIVSVTMDITNRYISNKSIKWFVKLINENVFQQ